MQFTHRNKYEFITKTNHRLLSNFFKREVTKLAPELLGKILVRKFDDSTLQKFMITEVEAYRGKEDKARHAHKGKSAQTDVLFREGGLLYVYLIYGMYWMLNIVTGDKNDASAVLIRGLQNISGPGRVGKVLHLDESYYGGNIITSNRIWIEDSNQHPEYTAHPRIGIHYADEPWMSKPWRFVAKF